MKLSCIASTLPGDARRGTIPPRNTASDDAPIAAWLRTVGPNGPIIAAPEIGPALARSCADLGMTIAPDLSERDHGQWHGYNLRDLSPDAVRRWVEDPDFAPPDGESMRAAFERIGGWLDHLPDGAESLVVIARPAVVRMLLIRALGGGVEMTRHLDVMPASRSAMSRHGGWRVSAIGVPLG
ncbi:histidine phosphatase family protein [Acetobacter sp. TBRC 12305]|uniref:Histidine phosphatase family protein n=1 Tax=Acetobacter garciniae TaxID=2817435 RepID=A0A939KNH4_9PROT|nr:histidine phosphatase family protein [Acetobacter garciniae]MBO1325705.1 histidine phosphatase family protein [Acetobacter garciniae]MBX0345605.1 histidine phosphatase family protein [Acetobacter garciniae]